MVKSTVKVCVLRSAGTNCDKETAFAFEAAGADARLVHINRFKDGEESFGDYQILAFPGGFTYGDDIAAGRIFANELKHKLSAQLKRFIKDGKLIIGICNGFQILVKSGLLPGNDRLKQESSLIINDCGRFQDYWVYLKSPGKCVWTKGLAEVIYLPIAHGEGKFVVRDKAVLGRLRRNKQIVFQYCNERGEFTGYPDNPNGSVDNIAGICDETGRVLGLMPHPERHIDPRQHPRWSAGLKEKEGHGMHIFRNAVLYAKKHL